MTTPSSIEELIDQALAPDDYPADLPTEAVMEAIGEHGAAELREQYAPILEAWRITGENTALWVANKLRLAEARLAAAAATAAELRAVADAHEASIAKATEHDVRYFTGKLHEYHRESIAGTRRKTTKLPGGIELKTGAGSVTTEIDDEKALADWLEDHYPEALEYPDPKIKKAELGDYKAKVDADPGDYPAVDVPTGERVPGLHFTRKPERFAIVLPDSLTPDADADEEG